MNVSRESSAVIRKNNDLHSSVGGDKHRRTPIRICEGRTILRECFDMNFKYSMTVSESVHSSAIEILIRRCEFVWCNDDIVITVGRDKRGGKTRNRYTVDQSKHLSHNSQ
jgi:hypothetical protein